MGSGREMKFALTRPKLVWRSVLDFVTSVEFVNF